MIEIRLRSRVSQKEMDSKIGKIITPDDYNLMITRSAKVLKPNGKPLCVYLPGELKKHTEDQNLYEILHSLHKSTTSNRGLASGTKKIKNEKGTQYKSIDISSNILGSMDPNGRQKYCRLTAWTGKNIPSWQYMSPFLQSISESFRKNVPDRYEKQLIESKKAKKEWVVPGTPFTTVTVNNSYPTGVHTDKGDLEKGFSTISCFRRGNYSGGQLCFPEWRISVDLKDGDLICMDAHDWHGNVAMVCQCGEKMNGPCSKCGDERISVVSYFREKITECGTMRDEYERASQIAEKRTKNKKVKEI